MRTLVLALVVLAIAMPAVPVAAAHHTGHCTPDYPCDPLPPCDAKCWLTHFTLMVKCAVDPSYC